MSRGPDTHQREILHRLDARGWTWVAALPYRSACSADADALDEARVLV